MSPFHDYLCQRLADMLGKHGVVVFYDPRREFALFFERDLPEAGTGCNGLPKVLVGDRPALLARYAGSFFALRAAVEPVADQDQPEALIVYLPGVRRDRQGSVLMELEKGGTCYEPQLKHLALNVLRKRFTDGQIDDMLRPAKVTYDDIVSFLRQGDEGASASVLRALFDEVQSESLLVLWLGDDGKDAAIVEKEATRELFKLIETRLGLPLPVGTTIAEARSRTLRYVLVGEFRADLHCEPPSSVAMIPAPPSEEHLKRVRDIAYGLRRSCAASYSDLADHVENDLRLGVAELGASCLGSTDTFRFEEQRLLAYAGELIAGGKYEDGLEIVTARAHSFWVDRDVARQAQWEACRLMAELGRDIERVRPALAKIGTDPAKWVKAYAGEAGWFQVDALQRRLETWVAKMDDEPAAEKALAVVRREHEELLKRMADGFARALAESAWTVPGILHQTRIYPEAIEAVSGPVACFVVDAMRFGMGAEVAKQIEGAEDLNLRPAIAVLPSVTPVGMAALLPGASASFSVVEHKGKLATRIESTHLVSFSDRFKFLKSRVPGAAEITLGRLLNTPASRLRKTLRGRSLVVVRSQEIDFVGEMDGDLLARQVMDTIIGNVARAVKKLASVGFENFVITADHGHQFSIRKDEDMKTDNPGGDTLEIHRRCWVGHGGTTPPGTVRITGPELGYDTDLDFVFPTGLGVFKAGGGLGFHHGGFSLQELVIPVLTLRLPAKEAKAPGQAVVQLRGIPDKITNRTFGVRLAVTGNLFTSGPLALRIILVAGGEQVGQTGMVVDAEFDRAVGTVHVRPQTEASIGLMLTRDDCTSLRIVVQDPATDAVLAQSDEIPVTLGI